MELSENIIPWLDKALYDFPSKLNAELENTIDIFFSKKGDIKRHIFNFPDIISSFSLNGMLTVRDYKESLEFQNCHDMISHVHTEWKWLKKSELLSKSFTFSYAVVKRFYEEYPEYIMCTQILAQIERTSAPKPLNFIDPGARVSFYFYNPSSDGPVDLNWHRKLPPYLEKTLYFRFSTFDLPLLDWMIKKAKYEDRERKKKKARERARAKKASELAHAQRMAYVNNIEK